MTSTCSQYVTAHLVCTSILCVGLLIFAEWHSFVVDTWLGWHLYLYDVPTVGCLVVRDNITNGWHLYLYDVPTVAIRANMASIVWVMYLILLCVVSMFMIVLVQLPGNYGVW